MKKRERRWRWAYSISECLPQGLMQRLKNSTISTSQKWCKVTHTWMQGLLWVGIQVSVKFLLSLFFYKTKYESVFNKGTMFFKSGLSNSDMRTVVNNGKVHMKGKKCMGKTHGKKWIGNSVPSYLQIKVFHWEMIIMFHEIKMNSNSEVDVNCMQSHLKLLKHNVICNFEEVCV